MDSKSTRHLLSRAKQGDKGAFSTIVELYHHRLHGLVSLRLGPELREHLEVEDVLQETYLRAFRAIEGFNWHHPGSFFQWLGTIAEHVIHNSARKLKTKKRNGSERPIQGSSVARGMDIIDLKIDSPSKTARREERLMRLEQALSELNEDQREAIVLAKIYRLPIQEVARRMSRSPEAVSMLILRGLRKLRKTMGSTISLSLPSRPLRLSSGKGPKPWIPPTNGSNGVDRGYLHPRWMGRLRG